MEFTHHLELSKRKKADALVLPFWRKEDKVLPAFVKDGLTLKLDAVLSTPDFKGKQGEILLYYSEGQPEKRIILLGLGSKEKLTKEILRISFGALTKHALAKKITNLNIAIPQQNLLNDHDLFQSMTEGLLLPNYFFHPYKQKEAEEDEAVPLQNVAWIGPQKNILEICEKTAAICGAVYYARDLVNRNADEITPPFLVKCAQDLSANDRTIKTHILDKKHLEKEGFGLLLAVNRGSCIDPALIIMEYRGNPKSDDHTVVVGKGVTYDTGGLNLKPTGGMEEMKCDMAGGAACFGMIMAAAALRLKVNFTVVIPTTENSIDANSFKPGDVYVGYSGKSVEMMNSDAEGRLILADALAYACNNLHPTRIIDIATLTGAIEIALGSEASGLMSTDDHLADLLIQAGSSTHERVWRMPLFDEYKDILKSNIADIKSWNGRSASSNVAATFLRAFVDESIPWAHLDIAGTAYLREGKKYLPKYATGVGIRLIVEFLEQLAEKKKSKALKNSI